MDKKKILALIKDETIQNYSYHIFFFLVFTFFVIFAIFPNLRTAFELQKELQELRLADKKAEEVILQIVNYQTLFEQYRDGLDILDQAVPSSPEIAEVIEELSRTASDSGILVDGINVEAIALKGDIIPQDGLPLADSDAEINDPQSEGAPDVIDTTQISESNTDILTPPELLSFTITIDGETSLQNVTAFLNAILNQRRLKTYDLISLATGEENDSIVLNLVIRIYYL